MRVWTLVLVLAQGCQFDPAGGDPRDRRQAPAVDAPGPEPLPPADGPADPIAPTDADPSQIEPSCPDGYVRDPGTGTSYRVADEGQSWLDAENDCEGDGETTHLAVVDTTDERAMIDRASPAEIWVGVSSLQNATVWRWVTGDALDLGDATVSAGFGRCGRVTAGLIWINGDCDDQHPYVCECDGRAASDDNY